MDRPPPGVVLRPLAPADAAAAVAVIHAAFRAQSVATDPPSGALRETEAGIAARIAAGGGAAALADGAMVAVVLWEMAADALDLGRLAVLPEWRRRGLARALVAAAEGEARRRGLARLTLGVRLALEDNRRLFAGCGFVETGREAHAGYAAPTSARMDKRLG